MFTKNEIYETYEQYKIDLKTNIMPSKILILSKTLESSFAMVNRVFPEFFELYLSEKSFYLDNINKDYLRQILYHEFTHVEDKLTYLKTIQDEKMHRNSLFAYTEFRAAQNEIKKMLNLFSNPLKEVTNDTKVQSKHNLISLETFFKNEREEFAFQNRVVLKDPSVKNIQIILYLIIYNIGYNSVLQQYKLSSDFRVGEVYPYAKEELEKLERLLLYETPSDILCLQTSAYAYNIAEKFFINLNKNKVNL